jgi:hypothetical protein
LVASDRTGGRVDDPQPDAAIATRTVMTVRLESRARSPNGPRVMPPHLA